MSLDTVLAIIPSIPIAFGVWVWHRRNAGQLADEVIVPALRMLDDAHALASCVETETSKSEVWERIQKQYGLFQDVRRRVEARLGEEHARVFEEINIKIHSMFFAQHWIKNHGVSSGMYEKAYEQLPAVTALRARVLVLGRRKAWIF